MVILLVSAATGVSSDMPEGINSTGYSGRTTSAFREVACEAWSSFFDWQQCGEQAEITDRHCRRKLDLYERAWLLLTPRWIAPPCRVLLKKRFFLTTPCPILLDNLPCDDEHTIRGG